MDYSSHVWYQKSRSEMCYISNNKGSAVYHLKYKKFILTIMQSGAHGQETVQLTYLSAHVIWPVRFSMCLAHSKYVIISNF